jgi:rhomboid protease GluP
MSLHPLPLVAVGPQQADEWALALTSAGISSRIDADDHGWRLLVQTDEAARATAILEAFVEENARAAPDPEFHDAGPSPVPVILALALVGFWVITGPREAGSRWFEHGSANAARLLNGELWRAITALTLHADLAHVLANAVGLVVFTSGLCRAFGSGVALWLLLLSGGAGNLLNALLRGPGHASVGASTALFGAVGALAATQAVRRRGRRVGHASAWLPVAAGVALLALLGSAAHTDVLAHLFGFVAGLVAGVGAATLLPHPPGPGTQRWLGFLAAATVSAAWVAALG